MAGDVHTYKLTIKGLDFFAATKGRDLSNVALESLDRENERMHVTATACEVDLHHWFNEESGNLAPFPQGTLLNFMRIYD